MLPVRRVTFFKHGVAAYQREGTVVGEAQVELSFDARDMDDVLKSLTVLDLSGGRVGAVSCDAHESLGLRHGDGLVAPSRDRALLDVLQRLAGCEAEVSVRGRTVRGRILGTETWRETVGGSTADQPQLVLADDRGGLHRVDLRSAEEIRVLDATVWRNLEQILATALTDLRRELKTVRIQFLGEGERRVRVGYTLPSPVWQVSYRVLVPRGGSEPLLQGWAVVHNPLDEDLVDVRLRFVSGLPITFSYDLYQPRFRSRPRVQVETEAPVATPVPGAERARRKRDTREVEPVVSMAYAAKRQAPPRVAAPARAEPADEADLQDRLEETVPVTTVTEEVGDLLVYEVAEPVSLPARQSALVPILGARLPIERVALYDAGMRQDHPMSAFWLHNDTDLVLEAGPATVYEGTEYVGEALLPRTRPGQRQLVAYSVELGVQVVTEHVREKKDVVRVLKRGHMLYKVRRVLLHTRYRFQSKLAEPLVCFVDHTFEHRPWEGMPEPVEKQGETARYRVELAPGAETVFVASEVVDEAERIEIPKIARATVRDLVDGRLVSEEARAQLERIAELSEEIGRLEEELSRLEEEAARLSMDQDRIRKNLQSLGASPEEQALRTRYVQKLTRQEEALDATLKQLSGIEAQLDQARRRRDELVEQLRLD